MAHAFLGPSGLDAAIGCEIKIWAEQPYPNTSSPAASEGTAAHELAADCLVYEVAASAYIGHKIIADGITYIVDADMASFVQVYLDYVNAIDGLQCVEQKLPIEFLTGEKGAQGTADVVIISPDGETITVCDLKYGRGVQVNADNNAQLRAYGLAALRQYDLVYDIKTINLAIVQPRLGHIDTETITTQELIAWGQTIRAVADRILAGPSGLTATPNDKSCKFCRAKANCPALHALVTTTVTNEFNDLTETLSLPNKVLASMDRIQTIDNEQLAAVMPHLDLINDWCNAVKAECERRMFDGQTVTGFKVVAGKKGNRSWTDEETVAKILAALPNEDIFSMKLISPTKAEKVVPPELWEQVKEMVYQPSGKSAVVSSNDKRAAIDVTNPVDEFQKIED